MQPIRVLLVEDDPAVAELVTLGLGAEYVCEQAAEARTALRLAARTAPAAVILDLRLRGGDGLDRWRPCGGSPRWPGCRS